MTPLLKRLLQSLCVLACVAALVACGSSKTESPLVPTRVIGLGDAYNDISAGQYTVQGTLAEVGVSTVVDQVRALFGSGVVTSYASSTYARGDLITQINNNVGSLSSSDLIVITAGTTEFIGGVSGTDFLADLKAALDLLRAKGAKHILIMSVVDISAAGHYADPVTFNWNVSGGLNAYTDIARYANINRPSAYFPGWATTGATPFCKPAVVAALQGCAFNLAGNQTGNVANYFLADNLHPTPAGNRWIASYLFASTGGWR